MENLGLQLWLIFKWLIPAAIGSGLAVFLDKTEERFFRKLGWFFFGASISAFGGSAFIAWRNIQSPEIQGLVYFGLGVWGMGIVIQTLKSIPHISENVTIAITKAVEKWLSK